MIYLFNVKKELNKIIPRTNLISFIQELEINGLYLSEVELPLFYKTEYGQYYNHKKTFDSASFFGFFDTKKKFQLYKIHTRKVDGRLLIVSGVHLFFDEAKAMSVVRDKRLIDVDAASATNTVFNGTGWTVKSSDVTPLKSIDFYYQTPQEARSRIIESWNIEFDYDLTFDGKKITSKNIYIKKKLGVWTGDRYSYGTNILSIVQEQDEAEVFTAAIGRGTSDDTNTALNAKVLFDDLSWSKDGYTKPLGQDYIEIPSATAQYGYYDSNGNVKPRIAVIDFEDIQDQKILADKTYEWLQQNCVPKVSYQTTVAKAGDYYLGDEIGIIYKDIDIVKKARVEKIKVNMLNPKLSELGLGDYQFFKQDRFKKNIRNEISTVKKDTLTGIQKIRQEFSDQFDVTKQEWEAQIQQVEINATAQVQAAETRMNEQLSSAKSDLSGQISNSYSSAVQAAELKAKELDAAITQTVVANKEAADKTMGELNSVLGSTNNKVGTIEQNVTAVKDSVNALSQWKADKGTAIEQTINSVANKAWLTDINPITKRVETAEAGIITNADEILKRVTKTVFDSTTGRIEGIANTAKSTAASNTTAITTVSGKVSALEQWRTNKGTSIDQTIDAVSTKVWQNDIDKLNFENRNLLENSNITKTQSPREHVYFADILPALKKVNIGDTITISFDVQMTKGAYLQVYNSNQRGIRYIDGKTFTNIGTNKQRLSFQAIVNEDTTKRTDLSTIEFYSLYDSGDFATISNMKIERGTKATPYSIAPEDAENRMTEIESTANAVKIQADAISKDYVKQSAVLVQSDGVLIGSKKVSGAEIASAISVTPSNVDIITKAMRITGDMAVAGDIKSLSLSAIYADIANLRASVISADSVTSVALKVDTALMDKLNVNSILTNKLLADNAMINAIKSNAITAVRGDIAYLKANIITADSITSTALKADLSMIDKLFASSALINQLTSKTAFIDSINAISVTTNSVLINSIKGDIGKPNSGIKITRPDGAVWMENGMVKDEYMVTSTMPYFMSSLPPGAGQPNGGVLHFYQSGTYYATTRSVLAQGGTHYTDFGRLTFYRFYQKARYVVLRVVINCKNTGGVVMIRNTANTIYEIASVAQNDSRADSNGEVIIDLIEDMGTPDYSRKNFYVYFKPNSQGSSTAEALIRIMECRITDYL
ncbi:phage tail spike protein [Macrococcoides caseolyticum]|uniref:phage tail spike protein n=1 Tax=Macrococcoides caseolyticum TaxID=69966 RepID=UPI0011A5637E|nr:phage tail spike protein [Macrococcus caseolyticus]